MTGKQIINYILQEKSDLAKDLIEKCLYEKANRRIILEEKNIERKISKLIENKMNKIVFPIFEEEEKKY